MSTTDQPEHDDQDVADALAATPPEEGEDLKKAVPAWVISAIVHACILGVMSLIVYAAQEQPDEPAIKAVTLPKPPVDEKKTIEAELDPQEVELEIVENEQQVVNPESELEVTDVNVSREEELESELPKGREEAVADAELGGQGAFIAIGTGGGGAGMFGFRNRGGKKRQIGEKGGSPGSEAAVDRALRWFKRHQSPNGQWDVDGYQVNCSDNGPKCEPGAEHIGEDGDVACTAYAVLCFLGTGYDHKMTSRYKATVQKGIDWLVAAQKADGLWGSRNYEHAVATMAIAEAYAMTNDARLREPAQRGVDVILARQAKDKDGAYGLGWDYAAPNPARIDASVSGWNVMALKSAAAGQLNVGNGMEGAKQYLERAWKATNKDFKAVDPYRDTSTFPYTWNSQTDAVDVKPGNDSGKDMAPVGALMAVFLGHLGDDPMLTSMANHIMKHQLPTAYPCNTYYLYYNTLAIFQVGGERWTTWNGAVRDLLVNAQRKSTDCFDGSWDFEGTKFHGHKTGRLLSTAYNCLSLQVYYRYLQISDPKAAKKLKKDVF